MFFFIWRIHLHISSPCVQRYTNILKVLHTNWILRHSFLVAPYSFLSVDAFYLVTHLLQARHRIVKTYACLKFPHQNNINCTVQSHQTYIQIREIKIKLILVTAAIRDNRQEYSTKKSTSLCCIIENAKFYKEGFTKPRFFWLELDKYKISL